MIAALSVIRAADALSSMGTARAWSWRGAQHDESVADADLLADAPAQRQLCTADLVLGFRSVWLGFLEEHDGGGAVVGGDLGGAGHDLAVCGHVHGHGTSERAVYN